MKSIRIEPNTGIGVVKLGMSRTEVHKVMGNNFNSFTKGDTTIDGYFNNCVQVNYDQKYQVNFIEISRDISQHYDLIFQDINVFETKADALVSHINKNSDYHKDWESESGLSYIFKDIGLSLWRPMVFKEEMLHEKWFEKLSQEQKDDQMGYRFFESIGLAVKDYWA